MLRYLIFSGGTGSEALQEGLAEIYGIDRVIVDIVINAYDNGKSTGACRRVFNNKILGPSDARKNQTLRYLIENKEAIAKKGSKQAVIYDLFEQRISKDSPMEYYDYAKKILCDCGGALDEEVRAYLIDLLDYFFFDPENEKKVIRKTVKQESFNNFSLSNIFYASCAALNGCSLQRAMDVMAGVLEIGCHVHLISDKNLFLKAVTQSGHVIDDEGDIVSWNNPNDKIKRAFLTCDGKEYFPEVGEGNDNTRHDIYKLVKNADVIVFSSGTQWSSLIPTYMHKGFKEAVRESKAKKYLVMNNIEDRDSIGVSSADFCGILADYLDMSDITIVTNCNAVPSMQIIPEGYHNICEEIGEPNSKTHDAKKLVSLMMRDYYKEALNKKKQFFDLDGTLWNEKGSEKEKIVGKENLRLFKGEILSGNSYEHVRSVLEKNAPKEKAISSFVDYGNTFFSTDNPGNIRHLTHQYDLDQSVLSLLEKVPEYKGKSITLRGGTIITVKPLSDQETQAEKINVLLKEENKPIVAKKAGKTSVDVSHSEYTKAHMLRQILNEERCKDTDVVFVGNELYEGSEREICNMNIATLQVDDVYECNAYLLTRSLMEGNK